MHRYSKSHLFRRFKITTAAVLLVFVSFIGLAIAGTFRSSADRLDNGAPLTENALLTYRITLRGSGDSQPITVSDPLPLGLEFVEAKIVESESCGTVSNLRYSKYQRELTFTVSNLRYNCTQSVDVITRAPELGQNIRKDFYNIVNATDGTSTVVSTPVNAYLGQADAPLFKVSYEYLGAVPEGAPAVPVTLAYSEGDAVLVNPTPDLDDYDFDGWYTADTTVANGAFIIGNNPVSFSGSFVDDAAKAAGTVVAPGQGSHPAKHIILVVVAVVLIVAVVAGAWLAGRHGLSKLYYVSVAAVFAIAILSFGIQFITTPRATAAPIKEAPFTIEVTMSVE